MTEREKKMLAFEATWVGPNGAKEWAIRQRFDMRPVVFYMHIARLIDDPEAERADPVVVHRLRRLRDLRTAARRARQWASFG